MAEFDLVLGKVSPHIRKTTTTFREPISPAERLMVTLRYLATGSSMSQLHYDWCISVAALSAIIPETCLAIYNTMKDIYLQTPTTQQDWLRISEVLENNWNFPNAIGMNITILAYIYIYTMYTTYAIYIYIYKMQV